MKNIESFIGELKGNAAFMQQLVTWKEVPALVARYGELEMPLSDQLQAGLTKLGIKQLYRHQAKSINWVRAGANVVIATPTASGKSYCYQLPIIDHLLREGQGSALYLYPTKALAQDQSIKLGQLLEAGKIQIPFHLFDGDTPSHLRQKIKKNPGIILSNPDMVHASMLPGHPQWRSFWAQLRFVVIDEIHVYRGVFGSHVANLLRRLKRIVTFYGGHLQFICCSATIANPLQHATKLIEEPFVLLDETDNGAPEGQKDILLYNPPWVDEQLGLRQSPLFAGYDLADLLLTHQLQTVMFARSRQTVELLLSYLQERYEDGPFGSLLGSYRSGYLATERRALENALREGVLRLVIATNALELGIDIGSLEATVLLGYPGSISSIWQQIGRSGRSNGRSIGLLIAGSSPLEQYMMAHPEYLFGNSPEYALISPDNLRILRAHLLCAAFELPLEEDESFGSFTSLPQLLELLVEDGDLQAVSRGKKQFYYWLGETPPNTAISLRSSGGARFVIQEIDGGVIGEIDYEAVPRMVHEGAIYFHQGRSYYVHRLVLEEERADVVPVAVDYYTRATISVTIKRLSAKIEQSRGGVTFSYGEVAIQSQATSFRKLKRGTQENLGFGKIELPPMQLETEGFWFSLDHELTTELIGEGILLDKNDYGPNWGRTREAVLERDKYQCRLCKVSPRGGKGLHIHHIRPFRAFADIVDWEKRLQAANHLENLLTVCPSCHQKVEVGERSRSALSGLAYLLGHLAPLYLMCDPSDFEVVGEVENKITKAPTLLFYEQIPAGVGMSERLFLVREQLLQAAGELLAKCLCANGCPSCVGPPADIGPDTKLMSRRLLHVIRFGLTRSA